MTLHTSEALDLTKENVQPLRKGRRIEELKSALQAQIDTYTRQRLLNERDDYECRIRTYDGEDPLDLYYNYVDFLEQRFLKLGKENNLVPLLEHIYDNFKDCDKYKQDVRFAQLLVKYINTQTKKLPLEFYEFVYNKGLATMCSIFYKSWAEELDKHNDFKRADQVFQLGLNCRAQPLADLQEAHIQFQLSIARRMLQGNIDSTVQSSETAGRTAMSRLKPSKVKTSRAVKDLATVFQSTNKPESRSNSNACKFTVYQEDGNDSPAKSGLKHKFDKLPKGSTADTENIIKASKWCNTKLKQLPGFSKPWTPSFSIHEDPNAACETAKTVVRPHALKIRKTEFSCPASEPKTMFNFSAPEAKTKFSCPIAVFEPEDPARKPMYAKNMVYGDGRDVQLEEIRAVKYLEKFSEREKEAEKKAQEQSALNVPTEPINLSKPCDNVIEQKSKKQILEDAAFDVSMTVHTRIAENVIQEMWSSPMISLGDEFESNRSNAKSAVPVPFDRKACKIDFQSFDPGNINDLLDVPFTHPKIMPSKSNRDDENLAVSLGSLRMSGVTASSSSDKHVNTPSLPLIIPFNLQDTPLEPEDKENVPPKDYSTPSDKRPLSGILTLATDIPMKGDADSEESDDEEDDCYKIYNGNNDTGLLDEVTCNTNAFTIALPASTPYSRQTNAVVR